MKTFKSRTEFVDIETGEILKITREEVNRDWEIVRASKRSRLERDEVTIIYSYQIKPSKQLKIKW